MSSSEGDDGSKKLDGCLSWNRTIRVLICSTRERARVSWITESTGYSYCQDKVKTAWKETRYNKQLCGPETQLSTTIFIHYQNETNLLTKLISSLWTEKYVFRLCMALMQYRQGLCRTFDLKKRNGSAQSQESSTNVPSFFEYFQKLMIDYVSDPFLRMASSWYLGKYFIPSLYAMSQVL